MTLVQSIPQTTETTLEKVFIMTDHWLWEYNATNIRKTKVGIIFCHTLELCIEWLIPPLLAIGHFHGSNLHKKLLIACWIICQSKAFLFVIRLTCLLIH